MMSEKIIFKCERDFQIWLGRQLVKLGFEVYTDKKICELPTFKGDKEKPDLLVFFNNQFKENKVIKINSPIAIETKLVGEDNKFNNLSKSILQIKKYYNKRYYTDKWSGEIKNVFLSTDDLIFKDKIYDWSVAKEMCDDKSFHCGMFWTLLRVLSTISNKSGFIGCDGEHFVINTPNSDFYFLKGGNVGYKPTKWNNYGRGNN